MQSERTTRRRRLPEGIEVRHARGCPAAADRSARCGCERKYRAWVWSRRDKKKIRRTFKHLSEAKAWRSEAASQLRKGTLRAPAQTTLREYAEEWLALAQDGVVTKRGRQPYKPSALRSYEAALSSRILPEFGGARLGDISRLDLQDFADRLLHADGLSPSSVKNVLMPLRAIYRRALYRGDVMVNPTSGLELPANPTREVRIADRQDAAELLDALPQPDRAVWGTALYAGLRRGELQALRWEDVDLQARVLRVVRAYDDKARVFVAPKSKSGTRTVPLVTVLRNLLVEHRLAAGRGEGLVFGADGVRPFTPSNLSRRAWTAWKKCNAERAERGESPLEGIGLHECRHAYASFAIAAGVNFKALSTYMGHATIGITLDRYGHLLPGNEGEAAELIDIYLGEAQHPRMVKNA